MGKNQISIDIYLAKPNTKWKRGKSLHIMWHTILHNMWEPGWKGSLGKNGYIYICMAESLHCSPETIVNWLYWASLVAQMVKNLPTMQEILVWSLDQEDPLEKRMAIHSRILAWRIPWTEESGGIQSMGSQRVRHNWATNTFTFTPIQNKKLKKKLERCFSKEDTQMINKIKEPQHY